MNVNMKDDIVAQLEEERVELQEVGKGLATAKAQYKREERTLAFRRGLILQLEERFRNCQGRIIDCENFLNQVDVTRQSAKGAGTKITSSGMKTPEATSGKPEEKSNDGKPAVRQNQDCQGCIDAKSKSRGHNTLSNCEKDGSAFICGERMDDRREKK